jgi:hypothetical protein
MTRATVKCTCPPVAFSNIIPTSLSWIFIYRYKYLSQGKSHSVHGCRKWNELPIVLSFYGYFYWLRRSRIYIYSIVSVILNVIWIHIQYHICCMKRPVVCSTDISVVF